MSSKSREEINYDLSLNWYITHKSSCTTVEGALLHRY